MLINGEIRYRVQKFCFYFLSPIRNTLVLLKYNAALVIAVIKKFKKFDCMVPTPDA